MTKHLVKDEKFLHSEGHLERYTELHGEEKREEGDRGDQEEKRGSQKDERNTEVFRHPLL